MTELHYNPDELIPADDRLKKLRQTILTGSKTKILETGLRYKGNAPPEFVVRLTRHTKLDGNTAVSYVDFSKHIYDEILSFQEDIRYNLRNGISKTICQKENIQIYSQNLGEKGKYAMTVCFYELDTKKRIFMIESTFNRLVYLSPKIEFYFKKMDSDSDSEYIDEDEYDDYEDDDDSYWDKYYYDDFDDEYDYDSEDYDSENYYDSDDWYSEDEDREYYDACGCYNYHYGYCNAYYS
ncbi:chaperonin CPN60, mitochondrial-like [Trichogramma pretiosum]|uniref:chaperonin CPN60, mitochondrial-like n=1 Tax=Trichogramma pretiosum TaxID=7493 RepID=UPI0006C99152|nr:chaperonin CPN60, mitochondrial-like [Trichogramma pretiosum]